MSAPRPLWRLIDTGPVDGPTAMAVDEALLSCFDPATSLPVLRLYGWQPPALSLGRFQQAAAVLDLAKVTAAGVPVVRRVTGGGVIYHADELTYAIVCAPHHLPAGLGVKESYRVLTAFLLRFYAGLGLAAAYAQDAAAGAHLGERTAFCFAGQESYDVMVAGRKLGGNAQRRLKQAIFQHGSIPLVERSATGLGFMREQPHAGVASTALGELGVDLSRDQLAERLADAFAAAMDVELRLEGLTAHEAELATQLAEGKYQDPAWNLRGEG